MAEGRHLQGEEDDPSSSAPIALTARAGTEAVPAKTARAAGEGRCVGGPGGGPAGGGEERRRVHDGRGLAAGTSKATLTRLEIAASVR